jgi:hypothetical protein
MDMIVSAEQGLMILQLVSAYNVLLHANSVINQTVAGMIALNQTLSMKKYNNAHAGMVNTLT